MAHKLICVTQIGIDNRTERLEAAPNTAQPPLPPQDLDLLDRKITAIADAVLNPPTAFAQLHVALERISACGRPTDILPDNVPLEGTC